MTHPIASQQEIYAVLREYNPWWDGGRPELPKWRRVAFSEVYGWLSDPPTRRAVLVSGARQVGKTTLLLQAVDALINEDDANPEQILYVTFDHPLLKLIGLEGVLKIWEESRPESSGAEYLLLDEIQNTNNWQTWLKHQVDFNPRRRIAVTGSAMPLSAASAESGVGRWHTVKLPTLSFYEYLRIKNIQLPRLPTMNSLLPIFEWSESRMAKEASKARRLIPHFHEYLLRGGFPETAKVSNITTAQKLLREDIVDKVLKRDMTALYGVRSVLDLERMFLYLCLHDGGILDVTKIGESLQMSRPSVMNFIGLLASAHLVYVLHPFGYGKQVLKGKHKVYLADPAIAGSVLLKGKSLLEDSAKLSAAVETAFFKHVFTRFYAISVGFSYWRQAKTNYEVDIIAEVRDEIIPFEVKYRGSIDTSDLKGIHAFCAEHELERGYVITRELNHFGVFGSPSGASLLNIPAVLACYWLSQSEHELR
jgi:predicted AAA+ superfamily ATPase